MFAKHTKLSTSPPRPPNAGTALGRIDEMRPQQTESTRLDATIERNLKLVGFGGPS